MASVDVNPFLMKDCLFQVEADQYEAHVSQVQFSPTSQTVTWKGLTPAAVFSFGTAATWVANLTFAQDWSTADSLSRYLYEHEGEEIDVTFEPVAGGPGVTATLIVAPGAIGGQVDQVATAQVSLGVKGKPVLDPIVDPEP
ncbi:hypothetical protein [Agromyces larvae]|uniref:Uncharacterized protein n=1 Tax=Agromyces larvae TaxID=2929802 RepID=A0ABY4BX89_9MICO|nr:hypothetical protein [Agromyces larvae]UOE43744.1 hypothetical protein MTO99_16470 [Agromyces larvae]